MRMSLPGVLAVLVMGVSVSTGFAQSDKEISAEKIRKILDQPISLDFTGQSLQDVFNHLKTKTGVNFVLDQTIVGPIGMAGMYEPPPEMGPGFGPPMPAARGMELKSDHAKLRHVLQRFLSTFHLGYVVLENSVLITTEDMVVPRQLSQRTNVSVEKVPVQKAISDLARSYALNLVIDPRVENKEVTLNLDNVTLETAMRLLAEVGGLKSVRMDNVLYVTTEAHADKLRKEEPPANPNPPGFRFSQFGGYGGLGYGMGMSQAAPGNATHRATPPLDGPPVIVEPPPRIQPMPPVEPPPPTQPGPPITPPPGGATPSPFAPPDPGSYVPPPLR